MYVQNLFSFGLAHEVCTLYMAPVFTGAGTFLHFILGLKFESPLSHYLNHTHFDYVFEDEESPSLVFVFSI